MIVALIGVLVGFAVGATGLGAGILTVPLLIAAAGQPAVQSVGTALVFSTAIKSYAVVHYFLKGHVDARVLSHLAISGVPGVLAGTWVLKQLTGERSMALALVLVGSIIVITSLFTLATPVRAGREKPPRPRTVGVFSFLIGIQVGFSSAGAGALGSVVLFNCSKLQSASVVGTNIAYGLALSFTGGLIHAAVSGWQASILVPLLIGGCAGVLFGASLSASLPAHRLRQIVLISAACLGAYLVVRAV